MMGLKGERVGTRGSESGTDFEYMHVLQEGDSTGWIPLLRKAWQARYREGEGGF
jgi:hypothetical protein